MIPRSAEDSIEVSEAAVEFELRRLVSFHAQFMPQERIAAMIDTLRAQAREQAIGVRLLIRNARKLKIEVPDEEVETAFQETVFEAGGIDKFNQALAKQKLDVGLIRESIADSKRVDRLIAKITEHIKEPDESELREYYDGHRSDFTKPERRRTQHILIKPASDCERDRLNAKDDLLDIKRQFEEGVSFSDLAATYSQCPSGKKTGGSIGWVSRGMMIPAFDKALFSAAIGEVSEIAETDLGYHILLATDSDSGGTPSFEEARDAIRTLLLHASRGKAISDYVATLKPKPRKPVPSKGPEFADSES